MKKLFYLFIAAAAVTIVSCTKENLSGNSETPDIVFSDIQNNMMQISSVAGVDSIMYEIVNPVEGGSVEAVSSEDWIHSIDCQTPGVIVFSFDVNKGESRSAILTVRYSYGDVVLEKQINVIQALTLFTFEIGNVTSNSAETKVTCNDPDITWLVDIMTSEQIETYGDNMEEYVNTLLQETADYYYMTISATLALLLQKGNTTLEYEYTELTPMTGYQLYAVALTYECTYQSDFYWSETFTTGEQNVSDITFDIQVQPQTYSALLAVTPSNSSDYYLATVIDKTFEEYGYTDEGIMNVIIKQYADNLSGMALQGVVTDYQVSGMEPSTDYIAVAFGLDLANSSYSTGLTKKDFRTLDPQPSDAYVDGTVLFYRTSDLAEYDDAYSSFVTETDYLAITRLDFNESAEQCAYVLFSGDVTLTTSTEQLYDAALSYATLIGKGDPAPYTYISLGTTATMCAIGVDASGNYGDMDVNVVTCSEDQISTDYELFDQLFNGAYSAVEKISLKDAPAFLKASSAAGAPGHFMLIKNIQ